MQEAPNNVLIGVSKGAIIGLVSNPRPGEIHANLAHLCPLRGADPGGVHLVNFRAKVLADTPLSPDM